MATVDDAFPSKYLKVADLHDAAVKVTIASVAVEEIQADRKYVAYFNEVDKGLVLNKINFASISLITKCKDSDDWPGQVVELYPDVTQYQGRAMDCVRVRSPSRPPAQKVPNQPLAPRQTAPINQPIAPPPASEADYGAIVDDEIPF